MRFLKVMLLLAAVVFTGCDIIKPGEEENINPVTIMMQDDWIERVQIFADEICEYNVNFSSTLPWVINVKVPDENDHFLVPCGEDCWVSISQFSGEAGDHTLTINVVKENMTERDRTVWIDIFCEFIYDDGRYQSFQVDILTIDQSAKTSDGKINGSFFSIENEDALHQEIFANETSAQSLNFVASASCEWKVTHIYIDGNGFALPDGRIEWFSVNPISGTAGTYTMDFSMEVNTTGADRTAEIVIGYHFSGVDWTTISIFIIQKGTIGDGEILGDENMEN